jgi:hypothetical protein
MIFAREPVPMHPVGLVGAGWRATFQTAGYGPDVTLLPIDRDRQALCGFIDVDDDFGRGDPDTREDAGSEHGQVCGRDIKTTHDRSEPYPNTFTRCIYLAASRIASLLVKSRAAYRA